MFNSGVWDCNVWEELMARYVARVNFDMVSLFDVVRRDAGTWACTMLFHLSSGPVK